MNSTVRTLVVVMGCAMAGAIVWVVLGNYRGDLQRSGSTQPNKTASIPRTSPGVPARPEATEHQTATGASSANNVVGPGAIQGSVRMKEGAQVVEGAAIFVTLVANTPDRSAQYDKSQDAPESDVPLWRATSNQDGEYTVENLPFGSYALAAEHEGNSATARVTLSERNPTGIGNLELRESGSIGGYVRDEKGVPVAGALVIPQGSDDAKDRTTVSEVSQTRSDAGGAFRVKYLPKGKWKIAAIAKGYAATLSDFVPVGEQNLQLTLHEGGSASGHVVEMDSKGPVPNTKVVISSKSIGVDQQVCKTDADGRFSFSSLAAGEYSLSLDDPTRVQVGAALKIIIQPPDNVENTEIVVAVGGGVAGRVYYVDTKEPVEGITIRGGSERSGPVRNAVSGPDGTYRIEGLAQGLQPLERRWSAKLVHDQTEDPTTVAVALGKDLSGIDFPVKRASTLRGHVVDSNRNPQVHAYVMGSDMAHGWVFDGYTKSDGSFEGHGYPANARVVVSAKKGSQVAGPLAPFALDEENQAGVELVLEKGASIAGTLVNSSGRPVADRRICAMYAGPLSSLGPQSEAVTTHSDGSFSITGLTPGSYQFSIRLDKSSTQGLGETVQLAKGQDLVGVRLVFDDSPGLKIAGRVTSREGNPVPDALINAESPENRSIGYARSNDDGTYSIERLKEGIHQLEIRHPDYENATRQDVAAGSVNVNVVLEARAVIEGQVVDAVTNKPIPVFQVGHCPGNETHAFLLEHSQTVPCSDPDGRFRLDKIEAGENTVFAKAKGYALATLVLPNVRAGVTMSGLVLRLHPGASVSGIVRNAAGQPVDEARVYLNLDPDVAASVAIVVASTNKDGMFKLDSLADESVVLCVVHGDYVTARVPVVPSLGRNTSVEVVLGKGGTITGTVRLAGKPVAGQTVQITGAIHGTPKTQTNAAGIYVLPKLADGDYTVHARVGSTADEDAGKDLERKAVVVSGQTTVVDFDAVGGTAIVDGIVTLDGQPQPHTRVTAMMQAVSGGDGEVNAFTGSDGHFHMEGLPAGAIALTAHAFGAGSGRTRFVTVHTADGRTTQCDLELNDGITVIGSLVGVNRNEGAFVTAYAGNVTVTEIGDAFFTANQNRVAGRTHVMNGEYKLQGLEPGRYTLVAVVTPSGWHGNPAETRFATRSVDLSSENCTVDFSMQ